MAAAPTNVDFEELAFSVTPLGELSLRRRTELSLGREIFEVKLGDEFLMSSLFTAGEIALADLGLRELGERPLDVVVGGLGLGYTAAAVLAHPQVRSLLVVEALSDVIGWHRAGRVPLGKAIAGDARCTLAHGDFFARVDAGAIDADAPSRRFHAILLDIDHSPQHVLSPGHRAFYGPAGLQRLSAQLQPGGAFALWSNDPPDEALRDVLAGVFDAAVAHVVTFHNPLQDRDAANTVYVARTASTRG